jgi:translation initiation factor 1
MRKRDDPNSRAIYSTDPDAVLAPQPSGQGETGKSGKVIKIRLEKKGRGGKAVTVAAGVSGSSDFVHGLAKELKAACGAGGTVKKTAESFEIEVQGDQRERVEAWLRARGFAVKRAGN